MHFRAFCSLPPRAGVTKLFRVMKLTAFLLVVAFLQVSAGGYAQTVTLHVRDATLQQVFREISRQTGVDFFYNDDLLAGAKKVTVDVVDAPLSRALDECFQGQQLEFVLRDGGIVVRKREVEASRMDTGRVGPIRVKGVVLTEAGVPIAGANVTIKQTERGTITNAKGEFELSAVPINGVLIVSFVGYSPQEIKIKDAGAVRVNLKVAQNELDKVVVQAYGTTTQRLTTSDIGTVTAEEIERQPVMNPLLALQGKVAGLDVNQTSGYASAPIKIELRGRADINGSFTSDPLYIVDGVPLTINEVGPNSSYPTGSTGFAQAAFNGPAGGQSPFFSINPADIESIQVLKDADATAIYGSRGANGVILVTTKKGKAGKTTFNLNVQEGINRVDRFWNMMNTTQYLVMRRQAFYNSGTSPSPIGDYDVNGTWDTTRNTSWQKALYGGTGRNVNIQSGLSGGDARTTFRIGAGYNRSTGITTVSGSDQRASASMSFTFHSLDQRLSATLSSQYSYTESDMINLSGNVTMAPDAPAVYDSLGNLNYAGWGGKNGNSQAEGIYPFGGLMSPYTGKTNFLNSNLVIGYELIKGLQITASLGYNNAQANQTGINPIAAQNPLRNPTGSLELGYNHNVNWIFEPQLTYNSHISKGKLTLLAGASSSQNNTDAVNITGSGYTSDLLINNIGSASSILSNDYNGEFRYFGGFGRISYNWEDKYILNLNVRRDGSSRFGPGKQFGNFGSVGVAWIASEEDWLKKILPSAISFVKLRGSYGTTGSDGVPNYSYLSQYVTYNSLPYNGQSSLTPLINPNPDFRWQSNKKLEGALNLGFVKDRVNVQIAWYRDRCGNQLVAFPTPVFTGFSSVIENSPALVQNMGWEFTVSANLVKGKKFSWTINFNTSINKNKLVAYPDFSQSPYVGLEHIGSPLNIQYALHYTGVDPQTGQYTYLDQNHDGYIVHRAGYPPIDDDYIVNLSPKFFGGLGMNFSYGALNVSLFFNIKRSNWKECFFLLLHRLVYRIRTSRRLFLVSNGNIQGIRHLLLDFLRIIPKHIVFFQLSDGSYTDASFVRLSNLSVSYNLPAAYLKKAGLQGCSLFVHSNNLIVITKYKGVDPETQNFGELPPTKTIVGGINFNF